MMESILGPQVIIVDDIETEVASIEHVLSEMNIGNKFFKVDYTQPAYPIEPIQTAEVVFLDLFYNTRAAAEFDPYACGEWLNHIIPQGKKYILIVWSKDTHVTDDLLKTLTEIGAPFPYLVERKLKSEYQSGQNEYNIKLLLKELNIKLEQIETSVEEFHGQIIFIEEESILINCLIHEESKTFEVRRFDIDVMKNYIDIEKGKFVQIKIITTPGRRVFEFSNEARDLSKIFVKDDDFEDIGDVSFLIGED